MLHKQPLSIAGITRKSSQKSEISWNFFIKPFLLVVISIISPNLHTSNTNVMKTSNTDSSNQSQAVCADSVAWNILQTFASTDMTLPATEDRLREHLGDKYDDKHWRPALMAVMDAENDVQEALESLQALTPTHFSHQPSKIINDNPVHGQTAPVTQLVRAEEDLMANVRELKRRN